MTGSIAAAVLACLPRSPEALQKTIDDIDPAGAPEYQRRDVTGDGIPETFCNKFVQEVCRRMGVVILESKANATIQWLDGAIGREQGWLECTFDFAKRAAARGELVIVAWENPKGDPGHVSVLRDVEGNHAQAGRTNTNKGSIESGFGTLPRRYFHHR